MRGKNRGRCVVGEKERERAKGEPRMWWGKMVTAKKKKKNLGGIIFYNIYIYKCNPKHKLKTNYQIEKFI